MAAGYNLIVIDDKLLISPINGKCFRSIKFVGSTALISYIIQELAIFVEYKQFFRTQPIKQINLILIKLQVIAICK